MSTPWKTPHLSDSPEVTLDVEMTLLFLVLAGKEQQEQRIATRIFHHVYITNLHILQSLDVFFSTVVLCVCVTSHLRTTDQTYSLIACMALGLPSNPCWDDNVPYMKRVVL